MTDPHDVDFFFFRRALGGVIHTLHASRPVTRLASSAFARSHPPVGTPLVLVLNPTSGGSVGAYEQPIVVDRAAVLRAVAEHASQFFWYFSGMCT